MAVLAERVSYVLLAGTELPRALKEGAERPGSLATLANRAVASAGPMPGMASSRLLVSSERWTNF
jgi:hypothetical protein